MRSNTPEIEIISGQLMATDNAIRTLSSDILTQKVQKKSQKKPQFMFK